MNRKLRWPVLLAIFAYAALYAESEELQTDSYLLPVTINFPQTPEYSCIENPAFESLFLHIYQHYDIQNELFYNVVVTELPFSLETEDQVLRQEMANQTMDSQINMFEASTGLSSKIEYSGFEIWDGYSVKLAKLSRNSNPPTFGHYLVTVINNWLIAIWAMGEDSVENRQSADRYLNSVQFSGVIVK